MTWSLYVLALCWLAQVDGSTREYKRRIHVRYPVRLLAPIFGSDFSATVKRDELLCFGNRDYSEPTYVQTLFCMIAMVPLPYFSEYLARGANNFNATNEGQQTLFSLESCNGIWGSRSVIVNARGSVEFLKLGRLPSESNFVDDFVALNATRWLELPVTSSDENQREIKQIPAEPIYLCARSNDWKGRDAQFSIRFRPVYIRERDKSQCWKKTFLHVASLLAVSSTWLLPYLAALVVAAVTYAWGINKFIVALGCSCALVCMAPLLLTKKNRHLTSLYFKYFFTRIQAEETRMVIQQRLPVFQALFFSSAVMCVGSAGSYIIYSYFGIDRETRNAMLKVTMGISSSWFVFFVCRSFERFFRDWLWLAMSVGLAQLLDNHLNPLSRDEVMVVTICISFIFKRTLPRVLLLARRNSRINKVVLRIVTLSSADLAQLWGRLRARPAKEAESNISLVSDTSAGDSLGVSDIVGDEDEDEDEDEDDAVELSDDDESESGEGVERAGSLSERSPDDPSPVSMYEPADYSEITALLCEGLTDDDCSAKRPYDLVGMSRGLDLERSRSLSAWSHDSHDAVQGSQQNKPHCQLLSAGLCSVPIHVLGPATLDGRRFWMSLATVDTPLVRLVHRGLSWLGPLSSRNFAPLSDHRRVVGHATFCSLKAAGRFVSWAQQRKNIDILLSLGNSRQATGSESDARTPGSSDTGSNGTPAVHKSGGLENELGQNTYEHRELELASISTRALGSTVTIYFKFHRGSACGSAQDAAVAHSFSVARRVLIAAKEQFGDASGGLCGVRVDCAAVQGHPSPEHSSHLAVQCQITNPLLAQQTPGAASSTPVPPTSTAAAKSSSGGRRCVSVEGLLLAHSVYQKLEMQRISRQSSSPSTPVALGDSARVVVASAAAQMTALGIGVAEAFNASHFGVEMTEGEDSDSEEFSSSSSGRAEKTAPVGGEGNFARGSKSPASTPSPFPRRSRDSPAVPVREATLVITMPKIFLPNFPPRTSKSLAEAQCIRLVQGHPGSLSGPPEADLTGAITALSAAAYVGFLLKFSESDKYLAARLEDEFSEDF